MIILDEGLTKSYLLIIDDACYYCGAEADEAELSYDHLDRACCHECWKALLEAEEAAIERKITAADATFDAAFCMIGEMSDGLQSASYKACHDLAY